MDLPLPATRAGPVPSCVMLLSLWLPPATPWRARLVGLDARVHEFHSPFELARFAARVTSSSPAAAAAAAPDAAPTSSRGLC